VGSLRSQSCFCLHKAISKNQAGGLLAEQTPGVLGVPRDKEAAEERGRRCGSAKGGLVKAPEIAGGTVLGHRHALKEVAESLQPPNPGCFTGPPARLADLGPGKAWSMRESVRGNGQRTQAEAEAAAGASRRPGRHGQRERPSRPPCAAQRPWPPGPSLPADSCWHGQGLGRGYSPTGFI